MPPFRRRPNNNNIELEDNRERGGTIRQLDTFFVSALQQYLLIVDVCRIAYADLLLAGSWSSSETELAAKPVC